MHVLFFISLFFISCSLSLYLLYLVLSLGRQCMSCSFLVCPVLSFRSFLSCSFFGVLFFLRSSDQGLLGWRLYNQTVGRLATLISMTMLVLLVHGQIAVHDVVLVPCVNLCFLGCWQAHTAARRSDCGIWLLLAALCIALAVLAKGLIGVAIIGVTGGLFAITGRKPLRILIGICASVILGIGLALPWFLYVEGRDLGYLCYYFFERHVLGYLTSTQRHGGEPWFYYLPILFCGSIPWIFHVLVLGYREFRSRILAVGHEPFRLVAVWLLGGICFLSLAQSKLTTYSLPLFPPIAIMASLVWYVFVGTTHSSRTFSRMNWGLIIGSLLGILLPPVSILAVAQALSLTTPWTAYLMAGTVSLFGVAGLVSAWTEKRSESFMIGCLWLAAMFASLLTWPLREVAKSHSQRPLAKFINAPAAPANSIYWLGGRLGSFAFYLEPKLKGRIVDLIGDSAKELSSRLAAIPTEECQ